MPGQRWGLKIQQGYQDQGRCAVQFFHSTSRKTLEIMRLRAKISSDKKKKPRLLKGGANTVLDVLREPVDFCKKSTSKIFRKAARADDALRI
jgi:hypothetical protein